MSTFKVDTYSPNTGEKLYTFTLSPIVVENHRVNLMKSDRPYYVFGGLEMARNDFMQTIAQFFLMALITSFPSTYKTPQ